MEEPKDLELCECYVDGEPVTVEEFKQVLIALKDRCCKNCEDYLEHPYNPKKGVCGSVDNLLDVDVHDYQYCPHWRLRTRGIHGYAELDDDDFCDNCKIDIKEELE